MNHDVTVDTQRAFIIVFPSSLEGLRFVWIRQMYEKS